MDLGVGSFVFALGMVASLPLLKSKERVPFPRAIARCLIRSAGILAMGVIRVLMVKGVDYPVCLFFSRFFAWLS